MHDNRPGCGPRCACKVCQRAALQACGHAAKRETRFLTWAVAAACAWLVGAEFLGRIAGGY